MMEGGICRWFGVAESEDPALITVNVVPKIFGLVQCTRRGLH
jgi:hypothetical protein